jgi:predicted permease
MPMGYDADRVLLVWHVARGGFPGDSAIRAQRDVLLAAARSIPGVESAAWISSAPFVSTSSTDIFVSGIDSTARLGTFTYQATTPEYFRVMRTRITRGRAFTAEDRFGAPNVAVVSESMARALWPAVNPIGQCLRVRADTMPCTTVVGVAEDMVQRDLTGGARFHFYLPIDQYRRTSGRGLLVRMRTDPARDGEAVRRALQRVLPATSYLTAQPLRTIVENAQRPWRLGATMFGVFGVLAVVVAAIGLYGVVSYGVTQRMHELGVRAALGARPMAIVRLVVGQSVRYALAGVTLGTMLALAAARWVEPLLFRQPARDPAIYGAVALAMVVVAVAASAWPASRAARVDPLEALREG